MKTKAATLVSTLEKDYGADLWANDDRIAYAAMKTIPEPLLQKLREFKPDILPGLPDYSQCVECGRDISEYEGYYHIDEANGEAVVPFCREHGPGVQLERDWAMGSER